MPKLEALIDDFSRGKQKYVRNFVARAQLCEARRKMEGDQDLNRLEIDAELKKLDELKVELNQCVGLNKWLRRKKYSLKELIGLLRGHLIDYKSMPPDKDLSQEELKIKQVVLTGLKTLPGQVEEFKKRIRRGR